MYLAVIQLKSPLDPHYVYLISSSYPFESIKYPSCTPYASPSYPRTILKAPRYYPGIGRISCILLAG